MRRLLATAVLFLGLPAAAQGVLGPDDVYVLAETAPAPVGGMSAVSQALVYPDAALEAEAEGTVVLTLIVDPDGSVRDLVVARAPHPALGDAALAAVAGLPFVPGTVGGEAVPTRLTLPIRFVLPEIEEVAWADQPAEPIGGWDRLLDAVAWPSTFFDDGRTVSFDLRVELEADGTVRRASVENIEADGGRVVAVQRIVTPEEMQMEMSEQRTRPPLELYLDLREAVLAATRTVPFTPEIRDGEAVAGTVVQSWRRYLPGAGELSETDAPAFPIGGWDRLIGTIDWPEEAAYARLEGTITLEISLDERGFVTDAEVAESELAPKDPEFEAGERFRRRQGGTDNTVLRARTSGTAREMGLAFLRTVERARFVPEIRGGEPVATRFRYSLNLYAPG